MSPRDFWQAALIAVDVAALPYFGLILAASAAAFLAKLRRRSTAPAGPRSRLLFVVPAHDEEVGIAETVASCRASDYPADLFGVQVIADNCTDRTAELAREAGAAVYERFDDARRSKGYAIEDLVARMRADGSFDRLDALVVVDADTIVDPGLLRRFDARLRAGDDWAQCYYPVGNPDRSWRTRLMACAMALINGVLPLGTDALGLGSGFKGNGMLLSTRGLRRRPWDAHGLTEDLEFSWNLRVAGERIAFEPGAAVSAAMPAGGDQAAANQRRRWEYGRKELTRAILPRILASSRLGPLRKLALALELTFPPMTTLVGAYVILLALNLGAYAATGWPVFLTFPAAYTAALLLYASGPFLLMGLPWRYLLSALRVPQYAAWKLGVMLQGRPKAWVRTAREPGVAAGLGEGGRP